MRPWLERTSAAIGVLIAAGLIALAIDVLTISRGLSDDDFRFQSASARQKNLWNDLGALPGSTTQRALGLEDDLDYRRAVALFASAQPGRVRDTGPLVEAARGQAALELTRASEAESEARRRSQLLNFLGLLPLARSLDDFDERGQVLRAAIGTFQSSVRVDPDNADAKWNLEAVLRDANYRGLPPNSPSGEAAGGQRSSPGGAVGAGY